MVGDGWPSAGDEGEVGATAENAAKYNGNMIKMVAKEGMPAETKSPLRVYLFTMFNENKKSDQLSERNYAMFKPDGSPTYPLEIVVPQENTTSAMSWLSSRRPMGTTGSVGGDGRFGGFSRWRGGM